MVLQKYTSLPLFQLSHFQCDVQQVANQRAINHFAWWSTCFIYRVFQKRETTYKFSIKNGLKIIFRIINKFYLDVLLLIMTPCGHAHESIFRPKIDIEVSSRENNIQRIQELWNIFTKFKRNKILKYRITEKN